MTQPNPDSHVSRHPSTATEHQEPLHQLESSNTLTYVSPYSTQQSSRTSSVEREKRSRMTTSTSKSKRARQYMVQDLDDSWLTAVLVACFFQSGLLDSVAFNSWSCFVSMQTGNTIFFALGIGGQPRASHFQQYYKSLLSIASFCMGTLFFNAVHRSPTGLATMPSSPRRWIFTTSFFVQTSFIILAAILVTLDLVSNRPFVAGTFSSGSDRQEHSDTTARTNFLDLCPVALLSFQAAGQVCLSRVLGAIELPTIVLSTLYHDFTADLYGTNETWKKSESVKDFLLVRNKRQEKRLACILALFVGGVIGGEMYKSAAGMEGALWMAAGIKGTIAVALLVWRGEQAEQHSLPR